MQGEGAQEQRNKFKRYVSQRLASENVHFYMAVAAFNDMDDPEERKAAGKDILNQFIRDDAEQPITLASGAKQRLLAEEDFPVGLFDDANSEVAQLLKENFFTTFAL